MILMKRDASGLYFDQSLAPGAARFAFLFADANRQDPTFTLSASTWADPKTRGLVACFLPEDRQDWAAFAGRIRAAFAGAAGTRIGWFPDASSPTLVQIADGGSGGPTLGQTFSLVFRQSLTVTVQPDDFGAPTTVTFDDTANGLLFTAPDDSTPVTLNITPPTGRTVPFSSNDTTVALPLTGAAAGTITTSAQLREADLALLEAGLMYFAPAAADVVTALRYPVFRNPGGTTVPFGLALSLDILSPLDPARTFFRFTDARLGSYFASSTGKLFGFSTVDGAEASRLVLASRPTSQAADADRYYYLAPAGRFGLALGAGDAAAASAPEQAQLLCGVTGTEFLSVAVGATPDMLDFVPGQAAWAAPVAPDATTPAFLGDRALTSWVSLVTSTGGYVSQPEGAPLYAQPVSRAAAALSTDLDVHILDFLPLPTWAAGGRSPAAPLAPYAGLNFETDPSLDIAQYRMIEAGALNPARSAAVAAAAVASRGARTAAADPAPATAMTPQGMVVELSGQPATWSALQIAISGASTPVLRFDALGPSIQSAVQKNTNFTVISVRPDATDPISKGKLFGFDDRYLEIGDWTFDLSPAGAAAPDGTPPIFIMKFYPGQSIEALAASLSLWTAPDTFNLAPFEAAQAQAYITGLIAKAVAEVYPDGPDAEPDETSPYWNFVQTVRDETFNGILALNCNLKLDALPPAIRSVLGGMKQPGVAGFRAHHVGISINDTDPTQAVPTLSKSATFALVDYEATEVAAASPYDFEVENLRALFVNSELRDFESLINLTIDNLFDIQVTLDSVEPGKNVLPIVGSYQAQGSGPDGTQGAYSFAATTTFSFDFGENSYLKSIALTKLQFLSDDDAPAPAMLAAADDPGVGAPSTTVTVAGHFGIWGEITFNELKVLDVLSFDKLSFSNLGIDAAFSLITADGVPPVTGPLTLAFAPGDLRLDLGSTTPRKGATSLLNLLPFRLGAFLYSQKADQTLGSLNYYSLGSIPGLAENGIALADTFNYALLFDLDLGSMGGLVGALSAFKFSMLIGWQSKAGGGLAFGVQLPQVDGKLELKIQGVITIAIEQFTLAYASEAEPPMLVLGLQDCTIEILGKRLPPEGTVSLGLFAPTAGAQKIGWIGAYNNGEDGGGGEGGGTDEGERRVPALRAAAGDGESKVFKLDYLGLGQRVGPDPDDPPKDFDGFLEYMRGDFWTALKDKDYAKIYHPDGGWLTLVHFALLEKIELGCVFYDETPFYGLQLKITVGSAKGFSFEIIYTKVTDTIGLFAAKIALPDALRKFEAGAASVTLPNLGLDVYTNGDWKANLGYPDGDDWSVCFRVEAMAGPVPVTGSGGFYVAKLSSATAPDMFKGQYATILAFGLALRLGVGKDFTAGPLKAGVSVTFFGIIQGAAGYLTGGVSDIFREPDALSLQGQLGIIGELYGSLDFVIIKASVNVRLQASIGAVMLLEADTGGSLLLYIEASVSVSVSVSIDLFLFSITVSFSFDASFRFEWNLIKPSEQQARGALFLARALPVQALQDPTAIPLCPGLKPALPFLFLPELTVVFADATNTGAPWFVASLGLAYADAPPPNPGYSDFQPFEAVATQLTTLALTTVLGLPSYDGTVYLESDEAAGRIGLKDLDGEPGILAGWLTYPLVLSQLAVFAGTVALPTDPGQGGTVTAVCFPMLPFLTLATQGRYDSGGTAADLSYRFEDKNLVPASYIQLVDAYFNQLLVNRTSDSTHAALLAARDGDLTPLTQEIFLDYARGLVRGAVHELVTVLQAQGAASMKLDALFQAAVAAGRLKALAGQMSSVARGGARLPTMTGVDLTLPPGATLAATNPLYALLWQEFPVGGFGTGTGYSVTLAKAGAAQDWFDASPAAFTLTNDAHGVAPYAALRESDLALPSAPTAIPATQAGPQSFAFANPIAYATPAGAAVSLCPFPSSLSRLQGVEPQGIAVVVKSRPVGGAYLAPGTPLPAGDVAFATAIDLAVRQTPDAVTGQLLPDVFAMSGASQADQALLGDLLAVIAGGTKPVAAIQILYPPQPGATGLTAAAFDPAQVFVLRTNTTTVSQPPAALRTVRAEDADPDAVAVAANLALTDGGLGFLQILQQATVTNAPGYLLRYRDAAGRSLDPALFARGPLALTILVTYTAGQAQNDPDSPLLIEPYHNAVLLTGVQPGPVVYAETTDAALDTDYAALAAGTAGVAYSRSAASLQLRGSASLRAAARGLAAEAGTSTRAAAIAALTEAGVADRDEMRRLLNEAGSAAAALNQRYSLLSYQIEANATFAASNLSVPVQPQWPTQTTASYRVVAPLYAVAKANLGSANPSRYAGIGAAFTLDLFVTDCFGNQLPTVLTYAGTDLYRDSLVPLDQWQGIVAAYDCAGGAAGQLTLHLTPSEAAFAGLSADQKGAALAHFQTIHDQITAAGLSFFVETNLALTLDGAPVTLAPSAADTTALIGLVAGMVAWLADSTKPFPAAVAITVAVTGAGALPPLFNVAVAFGLARDPTLVEPGLAETFPAARAVVTPLVARIDAQQSLAAFAAGFVAAFPALKVAVGMNGGSAAAGTALRRPARALAARRRAARIATAASGGQQAIWAVAAGLLDVTVGVAPETGPRYASPKPLSNVLQSQTVALPVLTSPLPPLPPQQTFSDVDLDQLNRAFFQAVDNVLTPGSAAMAYEADPDAFTRIARGREALADGYAGNEIEWLFGDGNPFSGTPAQLAAARDAFAQQMRAILMTAYAVDTIVQYDVAWTAPVTSVPADTIELFGPVEAVLAGSYAWAGSVITVTPEGSTTLRANDQLTMIFTAGVGTSPPDGLYTVQTVTGSGFTLASTAPGTGTGTFAATFQNAGLSAAHVAVTSGAPSPLTILYGIPDAGSAATVTLDLRYTVTHLQYYTQAEPDIAGGARPSLWLQLVDPVARHVGPEAKATTIPVVFRQFPTTPTMIGQSWQQPASATATGNPLADAASWTYAFTYQAILAAQDRINAALTYNTDLRPQGLGRARSLLRAEDDAFTLFEALTRFTAADAAIAGLLVGGPGPAFAAAVKAFADRIDEVVANTDWQPSARLGAAALATITDRYVVTETAKNDGTTRLITLSWSGQQGESSFPGATLSLVALDPAAKTFPLPSSAYPKQAPVTPPPADAIAIEVPNVPASVTSVAHAVTVAGLNVLAAENAVAAIQVERNLIALPGPDGTLNTVAGEFVYRTMDVRATQPLTPFIDRGPPPYIDVTRLPARGTGTACASASASSLCQRVYTLMSNLLADDAQAHDLARAQAAAGQADATRRVKIGCSFQFALQAAAGGTGGSAFSPLVPVVLARSFDIDGGDPAQLGAFSRAFSDAITGWAAQNAVTFGAKAAPAGAALVFQATLYAGLSGVNTPVLRLDNLRLALTDIDPA